METETKEIVARYDADTKRFHRFIIDDQVISGTIYIPKDATVPDSMVIALRTKADE